jgi:hypothetical protein
LRGVREADIVILILGERYGHIQASGRSATHEEYLEARERHPLLAFIQADIVRDSNQEALVHEVEDWKAGYYTTRFTTPNHLHDIVLRALHEHEVSTALGPVDTDEVQTRAQGLIGGRPDSSQARLVLAIAGSPRQQVLRPSEIEQKSFEDELIKAALFGEASIFTSELGTRRSFNGPTLMLQQDGGASISLDELGSILIVQSASESRDGHFRALPSLIEEEIEERIRRAIRYSAWLLDRIDSPHRTSDVAFLAAIQNAGYLPWRTRTDYERDPYTAYPSQASDNVAVAPSPPVRKRPTLTVGAPELARDLTVLLRRAFLQPR